MRAMTAVSRGCSAAIRSQLAPRGMNNRATRESVTGLEPSPETEKVRTSDDALTRAGAPDSMPEAVGVSPAGSGGRGLSEEEVTVL